MQSPDEVYRSFTSFRMTGLRFVVILSGAKDLYATSTDYIISIPQHSVTPPKAFPLRGVERPENSTVRCFQRDGGRQPRGTVAERSEVG